MDRKHGSLSTALGRSTYNIVETWKTDIQATGIATSPSAIKCHWSILKTAWSRLTPTPTALHEISSATQIRPLATTLLAFDRLGLHGIPTASACLSLLTRQARFGCSPRTAPFEAGIKPGVPMSELGYESWAEVIHHHVMKRVVIRS